jgi:hypothetical protein
LTDEKISTPAREDSTRGAFNTHDDDDDDDDDGPAALLLASSCAVAPFLPAAEAASQPIKQLTYCDGQGAAVRLGFEGYECPEHAIDPSFNSQSDPADSCEAIQVRGAAEARARAGPSPRPPPLAPAPPLASSPNSSPKT